MKKWYVLVAFILLIALLAIACSSQSTSTTQIVTTSNPPTTTITTQPTTTTSTMTSKPPSTSASPTPIGNQPQYGGTVIFVRNTGIASCGAPQDIPTNTQTFPLTYPVTENLILTDAEENIVPWLAETVDSSADGKIVTFTLKKGIKFTDGTDFNAQAVKYNLEAVKAAKVSGGAILDNVESYEVVNDYTLKVYLKSYDARFLLGLVQAGIGVMVSPTALAKPTTPEKAAKDHLVGTGPFLFDSWSLNQYIKMKKNPNYWQPGRPYADAIEIRNNPDLTTSVLSLKAGEVNMVGNIDPAQYIELQKEGYGVFIPDLAFVFSLVTDSANPNSPFAKKQVREAVEYAIDKAGMAKGLGKGLQWPADQLGAPKDPWYIKDYPARTYDPVKAKLLLGQAGYPDGFKTILHSDVRIRQDEIVAIQTYLNAIGIETTLDMADVARSTTFATQGFEGIYVPGFPNWSSFSSWANRYLNPSLTYPTVAMPPGWTEGWNKIVAEPVFNERMGLMQDILKQVYDQAYIIPFIYDSPRLVTDGRIMDHKWDDLNINGYIDAVNVWIKKK
jgi:peptide/nickel transport system substrate-binding protein